MRHAILKHLNDADLMNACLVSKGAYTAASSLQELSCRVKAATDIWGKSHIRNEEMQAEYLNSINNLVRDVDVLEDIADRPSPRYAQ